MKKKYKAIFWDNDGVLIDTEEIFFDALATVLKEYDYNLTYDTFFDISLIKGDSVFRTLLREGVIDADLQSISDKRWKLYTESLQRGISYIDGVVDVLDEFKGKIHMGVVTSTHLEHFKLAHQHHDDSYWDFVLTAEDFTKFKPHPQPYLLALDRVGLDPDECLVVEDSPRGSLAAKNAGIDCAVIPTELTKSLSFEGETYRLSHVKELLEIIDLD